MPDIVLDRTTYIEFPDNPEIDVSELGIEQDSLLLEEILCSKNIRFGDTNATRFEATLYNIDDVAGMKIKVYQKDSNNNVTDIFVGYVDSCKNDGSPYYTNVNYYDIVAYDALYSIGNADVAGWWISYWNSLDGTETTLRELRMSLCDWADLEYNSTDVIHNDNFVCTKTATITSVSFNDVMRWICEIQCVFPHIARNGSIEFIALPQSPGQSATNIENYYEHGTSNFEGYTTQRINKVELYDYNGNIIGSTDSAGTLTNPNTYVIKDNVLLFGLDADDAYLFVSDYLYQITYVEYVPCSINMIVSDFSLGIGKYVKTNQGVSLILRNTLSGNLFVEQSLESDGDEYLSSSNPKQSSEYIALVKKTEELKADIIAEALISYTYMNTSRYEITPTASTPTPVVEIHATTTATANIIFLATINFTTQSTVTESVSETATITETTEGQSITKTVTLSRTKNKPVKVKCSYWWNYGDLLYYPTEQYDIDGSHALTLCFFINDVPKNTAGTLQVKIETENGNVEIAPLAIKATMFGQGLSASASQWDGTITVQEYVNPINITLPNISIGTLSDSITVTQPNKDTTSITDRVSAISITNIPVITLSTIGDSVTTGTVVHTIRIITEFASQYTYNTVFVSTTNNMFQLKTNYTYTGTATTVDSGLLTEVEIPLNNFDTITNLEVNV